MKRLFLAIALLVAPSSAWALCSQIPLNIKDAASNTVAMSSASAADGNCKTYIDADTSSQLHSDLTAPIPAGANIIGKVGIDQTAPGATNLVSAGQNGTWTVQPGNTANTTPWLANPTTQYPSGATPITASATGTTLATTATLAAAVGKTTYVCSLSIRSNATAAATGNATVTGTITGTLNYTHWTAPLASGVGVTEQIFTPCVPGSATNTGIAIASPAPGSGGTVSVSASGYQL